MTRTSARVGWIWLLLPLALAALLEFTALDRRLQDRFHDPATGRWWVDAHDPAGRALFYTGPKVALGAFAVAVLVLLAGPARWRAVVASRGWRVGRKRLAIALAGAALVPVAVGWLKNVSGVYCPAELVGYGGNEPYVRPFCGEKCGTGASRGHCWPAGHASGGFALLAFASMADSPRRRFWVATVALGVGWMMGLYQVFKGAHFLSHNFVTWFIALLFTRVVAVVQGDG